MSALSKPAIGRLPEGVHRIEPGLYLKVQTTASGTSRAILFRWQDRGKQKVLSLGRYTSSGLDEARATAAKMRQAIQDGRDPSLVRDGVAAPMTFKGAVEAFLETKAGEWRSEKHRLEWERSVKTTYPVLATLRVEQIETAHIVKALSKDWLRTPVTARRIRERVENVIQFANSRARRVVVNPAAWEWVKNELPSQPPRVKQHYAALDYTAVPDFWRVLAESKGMAATALKVVILTAGRSSEVRLMRWDELDLAAGSWTIPAEKMKKMREHRVPLSAGVLEIINPLPRVGDYVFPGSDPKAPLHPNVLLNRMKAMGFGGTTHGFRSSFKDWARETTSFSWELVELSLAHDIGNAVERSYGRSDLLHLRKPLMQAWDNFVRGLNG